MLLVVVVIVVFVVGLSWFGLSWFRVAELVVLCGVGFLLVL